MYFCCCIIYAYMFLSIIIYRMNLLNRMWMIHNRNHYPKTLKIILLYISEINLFLSEGSRWDIIYYMLSDVLSLICYCALYSIGKIFICPIYGFRWGEEGAAHQHQHSAFVCSWYEWARYRRSRRCSHCCECRQQVYIIICHT